MLAMLAFTACSSNSDDAVSGNEPKVWHVILQASMDETAHRALTPGAGNAINASFAQNDEVVVVDADGNTIVGVRKAQSAGASTTLAGDLNATSLGEGEIVKFRYLSAIADYDGQVGTLDGIAASQNYAEGTLTVKTTSPLTFESNSVTLNSKQSITKFSFTDGTNPVNVKTFGIAAAGLVQSIDVDGIETVGAVTGTLATESKDVYVALRNKESGSKTYSFTIQDESGNWYIFTKNANLENGKNYTASVTLSDKLPALTNSSAVGTIGVVGGLPAIVVDFSGTKKAVALMNTGALCPEHYGKYYTFANQSSDLKDHWVVPTQAELTALAGKTNACVTQNGVNGGLFTIGSEKLFLPIAGFYDNNSTPTLLNDTWGYYWSSTSTTTEGYAYSLQFNGVITSSSLNSSEKTDGLTVRPFHALP